MTTPVPCSFPFSSATAVAPTEGGEKTNILSSWQAVHERLIACDNTSLTPTNLADFAIYFCCVYQAFGRPADGVLAQQLAQRLAAQPWPGLGEQWTAPQVDQACALAWLNTHCTAAGLSQICPSTQLAALDEALYGQAQSILAQLVSSHRSILVRVARYLRLRLPVPAARDYLQSLLGCWPQMLPPKENEPLMLGLVDGLAAELLVLMRVQKAGVLHPIIQAHVQRGIRSLLAVKRAVDFLEQNYSVFPYQICAPAQEGVFSAEMSWRRGDVGQSWLLYEAHDILHDGELANIAELIGLNTLLRTSVPATKVISASLYRGTAGVAQLYAQLHCISGQPAYRAAYHFWLDRTRDLLVSELATLPVLTPEDKPLGGLVGIGLVLLTAVKNITVTWEAILI